MREHFGQRTSLAEKIGDSCSRCPHEQENDSHSWWVLRWYSSGASSPEGAPAAGCAKGTSPVVGFVCVPTMAPTAAATWANSATCALGISFSRPQRGHLICGASN